MTEHTRDKVTIAIPTFNRASSLRRTLESVLAQEYRDLEVLVGDNASDDETYLVQRNFENDTRVHWIRHEKNIGPLRNFEHLLQAANGKYFAWLADDDWLSAGYVEACVNALERPNGPAHVVGTAIYWQDGTRRWSECAQLDHEDAEMRVLEYLRTVQGNFFFYSMCEKDKAAATLPLVAKHGADWLHVARLVFLGKAVTLNSVALNVTVYDADNPEQGDHTVGAGWRPMAFKMLYLPVDMARDVLHNPVYLSLPPTERRLFAIRCAARLCRRLTTLNSLKMAVAMTLQRVSSPSAYRRVRTVWRSIRP